MKSLLLPKDKLPAIAEEILGSHRLIAPVRHDTEVRFEAITSPQEMTLEYSNSHLPPKASFFPQTETILQFAKKLDHYDSITQIPVDDTPTVLFGARPCDTRGLVLLDRVFGDGRYTDPYYQARRDSTLVVSLACARPRKTCFCHAVGGDPYGREGTDVLLQEAGDVYIAEAVTARGTEWLASLGLAEADEQALATAKEVEQAARERLVDMAPIAGIEEHLRPLFTSAIWQEIAEKCLACGTCTYVCPGCHCFNIEDRELANGGERLRTWDGCMYEGFTVHASGHNPRPDQASRWRQRAMHKFDYLPHTIGMYGCLGCGRCSQSCPVRLDIRDVIKRLQQEIASQEQGAE